MPDAPDEASPYLDEHSRATLDAAMARIIPTDQDPGAREAGVIDFLDKYLSGVGHIWAKPDGSGFVTLEGKLREVWKQAVDADRELYAFGVAEFDRRSRDAFGQDFAELSDSEQDAVLTAVGGEPGPPPMEDPNTLITGEFQWPGERAGSASPDARAKTFFDLLVEHTRQGFLSDPVYGGNRDRVGWKVIGFHGPTGLAESYAGRYSSLPYFAGDVHTSTTDTDA